MVNFRVIVDLTKRSKFKFMAFDLMVKIRVDIVFDQKVKFEDYTDLTIRSKLI